MSQRPNAEDLKSTHPHEIHSLLLLDYLIGNTDRHQQNLLLQEGRIAAIDNGRSFGDRHVAPSICYKTLLPHMEMPIDPSLIDKVVGLPVTRVRAHLKARCFLEEAALQRFEERYALLRSGLEAGLLPVDLVELFTYERLDKLAQASRPELASAAQRAVADYAQNGRGQLRRERERVWTQSLRLRPDSEPLFWPFEVLPPLCEEELDGSFKGSLYGVGSGMVYHYLRGFSNGPERLVLVDSDPQQVLANRLLHCAFEAYPSFDEAGRYFFTPWMRGKTPYLKEASLSFGEKKRCGREAKLLAQRFKRAVQAGFVESRSPQLRRKKGQHPLFALSRSWNVLHRLAKEKKIEVRLADPLDASLLAQAAGDTAIFFFGHLAERIAKVRMASDGAPESVRALIRFLNEEALKGLGGGKTSPRPLLIAETTSAHRHWLRHHHGLPQWQVSDLYAQV